MVLELSTDLRLNVSTIRHFKVNDDPLDDKEATVTTTQTIGTPIMATNDDRTRVYIGLGSMESYDRNVMNLLVLNIDNNGKITGGPKRYPVIASGEIPIGDIVRISQIIFSSAYNKLYLLFTWFFSEAVEGQTCKSGITTFQLDSSGDIQETPSTVFFHSPTNASLELKAMTLHASRPFMYLVGFGHIGYIVLQLDIETGLPLEDDPLRHIGSAQFYNVQTSIGSNTDAFSEAKIDVYIDSHKHLLYLGSRIKNENNEYEGLLEIVKLSVHVGGFDQAPDSIKNYRPGINSRMKALKKFYDIGGIYQFFTFYLIKNAIVPRDDKNNFCFVNGTNFLTTSQLNGVYIWPLKESGYPEDIGSTPIFDQPKFITEGRIQSLTVDRSTNTIWVAQDSTFYDTIRFLPVPGWPHLLRKNGFNLHKFHVNSDGSITNIPIDDSHRFYYRLDAMRMTCPFDSVPVILASRSFYFDSTFPTSIPTTFIGNQVKSYFLGVRAYKVENSLDLPLESAEFCITNNVNSLCNEFSNNIEPSQIPPIADSEKYRWFSLDSFLTDKTGQQLLGINIKPTDQITNESTIKFEVIIYGPRRSIHTFPLENPVILFKDNDKVVGRQVLILLPGYDFIMPDQESTLFEFRSKRSQRLNELSSHFKVVKRPKNIIISAFDVNGYQGHREQLSTELDTLSNLGFNATGAQWWNDFGNNWWIGLKSTDVRQSLESAKFKTHLAIGGPIGITHNLSGITWSYAFEFGYKFFKQQQTEECVCRSFNDETGILRKWLCDNLICAPSKFFDLNENQISLVTISDEPSWPYPQGNLQEIIQNSSDSVSLHDNLFKSRLYTLASWIHDLSGRGITFQNEKNLLQEYDENRTTSFRKYLSNLGFEPQHFGANNWNDPSLVLTYRPQVTAATGSAQLYYWTIRFFTETESNGLRNFVRPILSQLGIPDSSIVHINSNTFDWYFKQWDGDIKAISSFGHYDLLYQGRHSTICTCVEDNGTTDRLVAEHFPYTADLLRCSSMLSGGSFNSDNFVGLIHHRWIGHHQMSASYRLLSLIAHGSKAVIFYRYNEGFVGQISDQWSNRPEIFKQIADATRIVGESEDILAPGKRERGKIALLSPYNSILWDNVDRGSTYEEEIRFLHIACVQSGYSVDIIDEQDIKKGVLVKNTPSYRGYSVLYIMGPNVSSEAQRNMIKWVKEDGGTVAVMPGAAVADEYNNKTTDFNDLLGIQDQNRNRIDEILQSLYTYSQYVLNTTNNNLLGLNIRKLRIFGSVMPIISIDDTSNETMAVLVKENLEFKGITVKRYSGGGQAIAYAFYPGLQFWQSQFWEGPVYDNPYEFPRFESEQRTIALLPIMYTDTQNKLKQIKLFDTNGEVFGVERCLLRTPSNDMAIILLNWTNDNNPSLTLNIDGVGPFSSITSVKRGSVTLNSPTNSSNISITLPLSDVDIVMMKK